MLPMTHTLPAPERRRATRGGGQRWPEGVYVGRPSKWGNPYIVGRDGTAEDCIRLYRQLLDGDGIPQRRRSRPNVTVDTIRAELAGRHLLCWCPLDRPCHADVLLQIANSQ